MRTFGIGLAIALLVAGLKADQINHPEYVAFDTSKLDTSSFFEPFDYDDLKDSEWKVSRARNDDGPIYSGKWAIETPTVYPGFVNDKGLVMKSPAAKHGISYQLDKPFITKDQDLVVQYEVKLQTGLTCGGTYIKLLDYDADDSEFSGETPYQVMFGPDVCGSENKVHFILKKDDEDEANEHHLINSPMSRTAKVTALYTLLIRKDQSFEIRIDGEIAKAGSLLNSKLFDPPVTAPEEIPDPNDIQPEDWDLNFLIPDPDAVKPDDYDAKHGSRKIEDENAEKPEDWDERQYITDPEAQKPEEWLDEEDGVWEPPKIRNPKCDTVGCGKWTRPLIPNPDYRGPWSAPRVQNPNYKGIWRQKMIQNPDYNSDARPSDLKPIGALGFEVWTMNKDILFDNIYLGHSIHEAEIIGNSTFEKKSVIEDGDFLVNGPKAPHAPLPPPKEFEDYFDDDLSIFDEFVDGVSGIFQLLINSYSTALDFLFSLATPFLNDMKEFIFIASADPGYVLKNEPHKLLLYSATFLIAFTLVFGIWSAVLYSFLPPPESSKPHDISEKKENEDQNEDEDVEVETISVKSSAPGLKNRKEN